MPELGLDRVTVATFASDPAVAADVQLLGRAVLSAHLRYHLGEAQRYYGNLLEMARYAAPDEEDLLSPRYPSAHALPAVYGVGVAKIEGNEHPILLASEDFVLSSYGAMTVEIGKGPFALDHWEASVELPERTVVHGISEPRPYFYSGGEVKCLNNLGTLGARVVCTDGRDGILTAGHVAAAGLAAHDESGASGFVRFSASPDEVPAMAVSVDVAIITPTNWENRSPVPQPIETGTPSGGDELISYGKQSGPRTSKLMGFSPYIYVPTMAGMWADVYFTIDEFSQPGDSGAPVFYGDSSQLVGHVVGGSPGGTSYVEAIQSQLQATGTRLK